MEEDLKLAQAMARLARDNKSRTTSSSEGNNSAEGQQTGPDGTIIKTHASMVLDKVQGFR